MAPTVAALRSPGDIAQKRSMRLVFRAREACIDCALACTTKNHALQEPTARTPAYATLILAQPKLSSLERAAPELTIRLCKHKLQCVPRDPPRLVERADLALAPDRQKPTVLCFLPLRPTSQRVALQVLVMVSRTVQDDLLLQVAQLRVVDEDDPLAGHAEVPSGPLGRHCDPSLDRAQAGLLQELFEALRGDAFPTPHQDLQRIEVDCRWRRLVVSAGRRLRLRALG
mmetsp:Transcript_54003/g.106601  ORF Transcript_54003/g.106601 Transcript_54003/m.106601 type:complete len:228 (+) Transcript_54003:160-843(+)